MVNSTNFKPTDIGLIPNNWELNTVRDLITLLTDYDANGSFASVAENVKVYDYEEFAWYVRSTDLENNSGLSEVRYVDKNSYNFLKKTSLYGGELLFLKRGDIGRVYLFKMKTRYATVAPNLYLLKINQKTTPEYLYFYFSANLGQKQLKSKNASSTLGALYKDDVKSIFVPLPPIPEQTAIATALSDMDELIAQTEKLIKKKKAIKQGVMQELLRPKEGWVERKLDDVIIEFQNGYGFSAAGYISNGIPIVTMAQIGLDGSFNFNETKVNKWIIDDFNLLKNYHLNDGDLIIAMTDVTPEKNLIGRMSIVKTNQTLLMNQRVGLLRLSKNKVNPYFLKVMSNMKEWRTYCIGSASLGVQANIGTKDITNGKMIMPNVEKQNEIAEILIDMDNEIHLSITKLQKLKLQKQGMMQALLTGKIRLV